MATPKPEKTFEEWQDDAFSSILQVTLVTGNPKRAARYYLNGVADELSSENIPLLITLESSFERVLIARLAETAQIPGSPGTFEYMLNSWRSVSNVVGNLTGARGRALDPAVRAARVSALQGAQALLVSYMGLSLQFPDMVVPAIGRPGQKILVDGLLADPDTESGVALPQGLLDQIIKRFANDGLPEVLAPVLGELGLRTIVRKNRSLLEPGFRRILAVLEELVAYADICVAIPQMPTFDPEECNGRRMQIGTALGPFLSLSAFPTSNPEIISNYYADAPERNREERNALHNSIRSTVQYVQGALFDLFYKLVARSGVPARTATIQYTLRTLATNALRSGMHVDRDKVVDNGFADNLASIWLRLSEPFTRDPQLKKLDRVDADWISLRATRSSETTPAGLDDAQSHIGTYWRELTRLHADQSAADAYLQRRQQETEGLGDKQMPGFIADCFFATADALHLGPISILSQYKDILSKLSRFRGEVERIERMPELLPPEQRASLPLAMQRWKEQLKGMKREKIAMDAQVLDPRRLNSMVIFYRFAMAFLLRQVDANGQYPHRPFAMPADEGEASVPEAWRMLPEFLAEDPIEFIVFIVTYHPDTLTDSTAQVGVGELRTFDDIIPLFLITFLARPAYIKNPYLKAKLVDVLHMLTYRDPREDDDYVDTLGGNLPRDDLWVHPAIYQFRDILDSNRFAKAYLVPALLRFYVDIEQTGASSQFYDKFSIRYYIARTLRSLWSRGRSHVVATKQFFSQSHRESSTAATTGSTHRDQQVIEQFVARLMTDTTYLLDESLSKLADIRELEKQPAELQRPGSGEDEAGDRAQRLQDAERVAKSYVSLAHETVHMLAFLSKQVPRPFQAGEVVDRLAAMLNYNLDQLAGPKCSNLRVRDMQQRFSFNPRVLLSELTSVYIHLGLPRQSDGSDDAMTDAEDQQAIDRFVTAVVEDDRSYSVELFQKAYGILERISLKSPESLARLLEFAENCKQAKVDSHAIEFLEDEAPDAYLDPVLASLITDPVRLPTSDTIMDLASIKGQLLSDPRDPFNRSPLTVDMLEPMPELKEEIRRWREAKLKEYYASK
ncbi:Ubiquitin conjugation factor E4 [Linderina pennispora]|nr:Ubiquitin conjugation factor E4 [Linderina pennispora]